MNIRQISENIEEKTLSPLATLSCKSLGRKKDELFCDIKTEFQKDRERIINSKSFRRLKHKTQVFIAPVGDHFRTRLTHTLEVSEISRTVARAMRLNEDLTEAIALAHDIGHTCFGHVGEDALNDIHPKGFNHAQHGLRVVDTLENDGLGLNLTEEVCNGILNHSKNGNPITLEGKIVRICDRIAYMNHDIDDALRAKGINFSQINSLFEDFEIFNGFDFSSSFSRVDFFVRSLIKSSKSGEICMEDIVKQKFDLLYNFMCENVYFSSEIKVEETKVPFMIECIYNFFIKNIKKLPVFLQKIASSEGEDKAVCDYIAGMTDCFAVSTFKKIFIPKSFTFY